MTPTKIVIICILFDITLAEKSTCGQNETPVPIIPEGSGVIQTYPWLGTLYYPKYGKRYTTVVVLVTKEVVIGSAVDIDKLPKADFRSRSRVVLGSNCSGPTLRVREYSYHPAYNKTTYSALVLLQLETDYLMLKLHPICPPPAVWKNPEVYAVTLSDDCKRSDIRLHKMIYVSPGSCKGYYNNISLNINSMWPTHTVCARAVGGEECVWRNGAVLMMRQNNLWSLMGFGVSGPGCRAPARFIDYGMNARWVMNSVDSIGRPAVTRIARNQLVMRRTLSNLQRFGPCDPEEIKEELFKDITSVTAAPKVELRRIRYNFTIISNMEYSCINFTVDGQWHPYHPPPLIRLRRWCRSPRPICYYSKELQVDFHVEIFFSGDITYKVTAYGEEARVVDMKKLMAYTNQKRRFPNTDI